MERWVNLAAQERLLVVENEDDIRELLIYNLEIVNEIHGDDYPVSDRSVDVQIVSLRKKLGRSVAI
jgi:hypothetical protein